MRERGIDISGQRLKHLSAFSGQRFDLVINLCDRVREICPEFPGGPEPVHSEHPRSLARARTRREDAPAFERTAGEPCTRIGFLLEALEQTSATQEVTGRA